MRSQSLHAIRLIRSNVKCNIFAIIGWLSYEKFLIAGRGGWVLSSCDALQLRCQFSPFCALL